MLSQAWHVIDQQQQPLCSVSHDLTCSFSTWIWKCQPCVSMCWPKKTRLRVGRLRCMWKALAPQPALYRHWREDPQWTWCCATCPGAGSTGLWQGCQQGKQYFIPLGKEVMKTHVCCCTLTSRCNICVSKQRKGQFRLSQTILR